MGLYVRDPGTHAEAGLCGIGGFDYVSRFWLTDNYEFLADGLLSIEAACEATLPPIDVDFQPLTPPACALDYVEIIAAKPVPVNGTTWGSLKCLYR
jgi:hypothetical protein